MPITESAVWPSTINVQIYHMTIAIRFVELMHLTSILKSALSIILWLWDLPVLEILYQIVDLI